jgi:N-hydroxyarylamine O-acetyltransferase
MNSTASSTEDTALPAALRDAVLNRLGFARPPAADLEGLRAIYRAWCERVPFDNVGKVIALRTEAASSLRAIHAIPFFETWLAEGIGATCWPSANALYTLLRSLGFDARRVAAHMQDAGRFNHGIVIVNSDGGQWLADSSLLTGIPLPLSRETFIASDAVFNSEVELDGDTHLVWTHWPTNSAFLPCRVFPDAVTHAYYVERYEATRASNPFNQRLFARRNREGEMLVLSGNMRFTKSSARGIESRVLSSDELLDSLRREFGLAEGILGRWVAAGGLAAAFEEYTGPFFPPTTRKPPSQR